MEDKFHIIDAIGDECFACIAGDTWFEIVCSLYSFITDRIGEEAQFVATYLTGVGEDTDNPNLFNYAQFEERAYHFMCLSPMPCYPTEEVLTLIKRELEVFNLESYENDAKCACGLLFSLIKAIDRCIADNKRSIYKFPKRGPLKQGKDSIGLYLKSPNHFIEEFFDDLSINCRLNYGSLNEQLTTITFFKKERGFELPRIISSQSSFEHRNVNDTINVAVSPLRGSDIPFSDAQQGRKSIQFEYLAGSTFCCSYSDEYGNDMRESLWEIVNKAIDSGCKILVLPEFVVNDEALDILLQVIEQVSNLGKLQIILAGTYWDAVEQNNVGTLILTNTRFAFDFDKYTPYVKEGNGSFTERLGKTEKRTTLVDIPGIGLVLPQICRDVVESGNRLEKLVKAFLPSLIIAPAWSNSINNAFIPPLTHIIPRYNLACVIANACGARLSSFQKGDYSVSLCAVPKIENKTAQPRKSTEIQLLCSKAKCADKCPSRESFCSKTWVFEIACKDSGSRDKNARPAISLRTKLL